MTQLFLVESPLQLLNAFEAIHAFKADKNIVFVRYTAQPVNDRQLSDTLKKLNVNRYAQIQSVTVRGENRQVSDYLKIVLYKIKLRKSISQAHRIFVGNYHSPFFRVLVDNRKNVVLLDDGFKTIVTQKSFSQTNYRDWFTIFDLRPIEGQTIYPNSYNQLKKRIHHQYTATKNILFIGSKISETGIIPEPYYIQLMQKIARRFNANKLVYIPHRGESDSKLRQLEKISNVHVKPLDYPLELLPLYSNETPQVIASFYSTALITLSKIFPCKTIAFSFDYTKAPNAKAIEEVYNYCEKYITVVPEKEL